MKKKKVRSIEYEESRGKKQRRNYTLVLVVLYGAALLLVFILTGIKG